MKKLVLVLTMALVALGGGAIHLWRQMDAGQRQIAGLQARLQAMDAAQLAAASTHARQLAAAVESNPRQTSATPPVVAPTPTPNALAAAIKAQVESPEFKEKLRKQNRAMHLSFLPDLAREVNLSAQEIDAVLDLLARQENTTTARAEEIGKDTAATAQEKANMREAVRQANDAEFAALLGSKFPQWRQYNETLTGRRQVTDLSAVLSADNNPVTDAQARQLVAAIGAEHQRIFQETEAALAKGTDAQAVLDNRYSPEKTQRLVAAATPLLNPRQVESYRQMLERQENSIRARQLRPESFTSPPR